MALVAFETTKKFNIFLDISCDISWFESYVRADMEVFYTTEERKKLQMIELEGVRGGRAGGQLTE